MENPKEYFDYQKRHLAFGEYSDSKITCISVDSQKKRTIPVHKAIISCSCDYLRRMIKKDTFKEGEENEATLEGVDPDIMMYLLEYIYSQDYTMPVTSRTAKATTGIRITNWEHVRLSCANRRKLREGLTLINSQAMTAAVNLIHQYIVPDVQANILNELVIDGAKFPRDPFNPNPFQQLLALVGDPANLSGTPWYVNDHDEGEAIHAKVYHSADYMRMDVFCDLALARLFNNREATFGAQSRRDAVDQLMRNVNQNRQKSDYMVIAKALNHDLNRFGVNGPGENILERHKLLREYIWAAAFHENSQWLEHWCFEALEQSLV